MDTPTKAAAAPVSASAARSPAPPPGTQPASRLSRTERDQLFSAAAAGMTPERQRNGVDPVEQWLPQIRKKYREGYSLRQILTMTQAPGIGLKLSLRSLQRVMKAHERAKRPTRSAPSKP